jgi:alanine-glyoxylate transaminase/serine-glyoxylate transaminase/serine-pyruvate transaminase
MLAEEGLENVLQRHQRHARATRSAVNAWGLEVQCLVPEEQSAVLTGVVLPEGHDADHFRALVFQRYNMSLGTGLGRLKRRIFRIGHLGDLGDLMLMGTLAGVESGLALAGVPIRRGGMDAALRCLEEAGER